MKEILAENLDLAIKEMCLEAKKTYCGERFQIWEMEQKEFEKICNINEKEWKTSWGMWRSAEGSNMTNPIKRYNINKHYINAWDGDDRVNMLEECNNNINHEDYCFEIRKYDNLIDYISLEIGVSQPRNICALAVDLARMNKMKMSELFKKYQGEEDTDRLKYPEEKYLDTGIYGIDEEIMNHKEKIVKCRKPHECVQCGSSIEKGEKALYESGFLDGMPVSAYTCTKCVEEWIEETADVLVLINQITNKEEIHSYDTMPVFR